ncbi:TadE/TadG family type IV pilus assembly protein [Marinibactrum halimedae]|uniref:TadE-like domain-containing protein n=1 Tax=Marinibactrum halimedae TaxID=1444977 RepID=A0AA37T6G1_9GAMM|nr:TadE family protein [Marinibactrum halimedae]MCD9460297.1 pilus assembly protein [Marinibactrum halimedae]GLS24385.1 hypothetical protein GCM10007877_00960 [Marinibactrum halimedae]
MLSIKSAKCQAGQGLVEHLILWPSLVFVVFGAIQLSLLYRTKATFNHVVFQAARHGATHNGNVNEMHKHMLRGLIPLYLKRDPSVTNYLQHMVTIYLDNQIRPNGQRIGNSPLRMEVISPTQEIFNAFARNMYQLQEECPRPQRTNGNDRSLCTEQRFNQIPNDNLNIRSSAIRTINLPNRELVRVNLQDANLLKVRGHWCAPLTMPLVASTFYHTLFRFRQLWNQNFWWFYASKPEVRNHPHWQACVRRTALNLAEVAAGTSVRIYYIPISADAVVRMQTPFRQ